MRNGVRITRKSPGRTVSAFIPEELLQLNQLNAKIQRNIATRNNAAADEQARLAEISRREAEANRRESAHRQRIQQTIRGCISLVAIASAAWLCVPMDLATPILAAVVSVPCLGGVCYKLGTIR